MPVYITYDKIWWVYVLTYAYSEAIIEPCTYFPLNFKDIGVLKSSGMTEDEIFELTVVAAFSAGETRVKLATDLLNQCYEA